MVALSKSGSDSGTPVAAVNGDFYARDGSFAGDPRGLQVLDGELISGPVGTASFWIDAAGVPHTANTTSRLQVIWPGGTAQPIGLNGYRRSNAPQLYTPAIGSSTRTREAQDLILERQGDGPWLPLEPGRTYTARVREIKEGGNAPVARDTMVLSIGRNTRAIGNIEAGAEITISTATEPSLAGVKTAISGGPVLVRNGKNQGNGGSYDDSYETSSMGERHPRTAIGWNEEYFFLVAIDGRHRSASVGMTLDELGEYLIRLGCKEAMNLDGGGSSTLWYNGKVRNYLCDGYEREIANSLIALKKKALTGNARTNSTPPIAVGQNR
jgi:hypothetical protein